MKKSKRITDKMRLDYLGKGLVALGTSVFRGYRYAEYRVEIDGVDHRKHRGTIRQVVDAAIRAERSRRR